VYQVRRLAPVLASVVVLFAVAGCSAGSGGASSGSTSSPSSEAGAEVDAGSGGGGGAADCVVDRTWVLDKEDLAAQLAAFMSSNAGLVVNESSAVGRQTFEFNSDGSATAFVDVTYTLGVDGDGFPLTIVQTHTGEPSGQWSFVGDSATVTFDDWDSSGYSVQNTILIDGAAVDMPIDIPSDALGETDMTIECSGDALTTKVATSPFTQRWNAEG
jgi:hypothetical protein